MEAPRPALPPAAGSESVGSGLPSDSSRRWADAVSDAATPEPGERSGDGESDSENQDPPKGMHREPYPAEEESEDQEQDDETHVRPPSQMTVDLAVPHINRGQTWAEQPLTASTFKEGVRGQ